jgi:hypothetical protein
MIPSLIDKQDNFEIIRDQVALILKVESDSQQALATVADKDPNLWKLRVFVERSDPWEEFQNVEDETDLSPIINVWFDNTSFEKGSSNIAERQKSSTTYNIDCYGYGESSADGDGHKPGDREAAFEMQRAVRLVRNIIMSDQYAYLDLRKTVWGRWPQSIASFQPEQGQVRVQNVIASRFTLRVDFNEFSPQTPGNALDLISNSIKRAETGELLTQVDIEFPIT